MKLIEDSSLTTPDNKLSCSEYSTGTSFLQCQFCTAVNLQRYLYIWKNRFSIFTAFCYCSQC